MRVNGPITLGFSGYKGHLYNRVVNIYLLTFGYKPKRYDVFLSTV